MPSARSARSRRALVLLAATVVLAPLALAVPATATETVTTVSTSAHRARVAVLPAAAPRVLALAAPARDVALFWRGQPGARVTVRLSTDGLRFAAPVDAGRDEAGEHRDNGWTYGALLAAGGATVAEVTSDRPLRDLTLLGLADGARSTRTVTRALGAVAAVTQPQVVSRAQWGADESIRSLTPTFHATQRLIVHHTAGRNDDPDPAATIRSIYHYHAVTQGWGDIGYNFLVDESGRVYEGRWSREYAAGVSPSGDDASGRGVTGAHTGGWNSGTVGVALLGTLTDRDATPAARESLTSFLAWQAQKSGLDPMATGTFTNPADGKTITTPTIAGHRDYVATECPGGVFHATLPSLRAAVAERLAGEPAPAPDTTPPTVPTGVSATPGSRSVTVSWAPSGDDVGVTGYAVARSTKSATSGFSQVTTTAATSWTDSGLRKGRRVWYRVAALDAAGNRSAWSATVTAVAG